MKKIYVLTLLLLISLFSYKHFMSEEGKIKDVCNTYMRGRIALESGDSTKLKPVTGEYTLQINDAESSIFRTSTIQPFFS